MDEGIAATYGARERTKGGIMQQILIATDGSPSAQEAIDVGLELAKEQEADVTFVHVAAPDEFHGGRGGTHAITHREDVDESESALQEAAKAAEDAGVSYTLERISGETVESIVARADTKSVDLIVMGSRGRSSIATALLGSVSHGVLRQASRPVLVVKAAKAPVETTA
jgi:nucleotide-binding universal stress UspA family protein